MIVDDAMLARLVVRNVLVRDPRLRVVASAKDGQEAVDLLPSAKPDLIILDLEMPALDGLSFLRRVRLKTPAKILVLSSAGDKLDQARALNADAAMMKPRGNIHDLSKVSDSELLQEVYRLLDILPPP